MTTRNTVTTVLAAALLLVAPLSLTACSGPTPADGATAADTARGIGAKWGACMRDAGFDVEDPSDAQVSSGVVSAPQGADQQAFQRQAATCSEQQGVERQDSSEQQKWAREYEQVASCIRDHGFEDYPAQRPGALDLNPESYPRAAEPGFERAVQDCLAEFSPDTQVQNAG